MNKTEFEVESVLDKKIHKNRVYYLVKWINYSKPSWVRNDQLNCYNLVRAFEYGEDSNTDPTETSEDEYNNEIEIYSIKILDGKYNVIFKRNEELIKLLLNEFKAKYPKQSYASSLHLSTSISLLRF
ncbi:hypothetical protein CONCODRAFT_85242 [Conidiobolus coronatus NRRL 28638]|uniref:Chromo domain-containing protein n=1 Tax=Conidiobolus coronatus (strain ATCC 28846 / CBS 209.66 / NRRL 28638) TaxID=796925 RepID=A0A137P6B9_CONC2|nr:hypothetical protein CONCODRAFT_85242 [Conidiobolus coronatus NRRL 28638]|eukprot:KXN70546.1 hypothetical protein CONCODRAFT_85242 [Conidiobolus coronatus NRRL 28638]